MTEPAAPEVGALDHRSDRGPAGPMPHGGGGAASSGSHMPLPGLAVRRAPRTLPLPEPNPDPVADFQLMWRGGPDDVGIAVVYTRDWKVLSPQAQADLRGFMQVVDRKYGWRGAGPKQSPSADDEALSAAYLKGVRKEYEARFGKGSLSGQDLAHAPDKGSGGAAIEDLVPLPFSENRSQGGQSSRYAEGFTFAGVSLYDEASGEWIYTSGALNSPPPPPSSLPGYRKPRRRAPAPASSSRGDVEIAEASKSGGGPDVAAPRVGQRGGQRAGVKTSLSEKAGGLSAGELGALAESARGDLPSGADRTMHLVGRGIAIGSALVGAVTAVTSTLDHMAAAERVLAGGTAILGKEVDEAAQVETEAARSQAGFGDFDREVARMCGPGGEVWAASSNPDEAAAVSAQLEDLMRNVTSAIETQRVLQARLDAAAVEATAKQKAAELLTDDVATRTAMALAADGSEADRVTAMQAYEAWTRLRGSFTQARRDTEKSLEILGRARDTLAPWTESLTRAAMRGGAAWQVPGTGLVVRPGASAAGPRR